ncbi:type 4a pilus biogenesis protein PilO [Salinisphaera sp. Q1T1-3]|uniref:type 4a pilus biogenesis protein PilO n=1 Tax=Salinisphaera sp. Q1T1-3 TaxID=2321229 RepID=UPI000E7457CA|nr:type 4a pilus biogenesis protein PilO [Salinisphaera sp. Q1T1-3]RJS94302.1 pilus assembly protein PilO [Salinisphaera sp. Q1T1-3]
MRPLREYIDELRSLDQNNIGSWPTWAYGLSIAIVSLVIMLIAGWYFVLPKRDELESAVQKEQTLREQFRARQAEVANLEAYRAQLAQMQAAFGNLLAQLPSQTEVPSLLRDISQARSANGLDEQLFKPEPEVSRDFYAELPNDLVVTGDFHQFGRFVSDVAALPRIVTIDDVKIEPVGTRPGNTTQPDSNPLRMSLTATTYRYLDGRSQAKTTRGTASKTQTGTRR